MTFLRLATFFLTIPLVAADLVITHVTVIDATGRPPTVNQTVLIQAGRIGRIGPAVTIPPSTQVIDGKGKYLIPGLWDMDTGVEDEDRFFPLCLANGVTGIRNMGGAWDQFEKLRRLASEIDRGQRLGPHLIISSPRLDGLRATFPGSIAVSFPDQAHQTVRDLKYRGADLVDVVDLVERDTFFAIANEARAQRLPVAVELPIAISAEEASNAQVRSMEHLIGIQLACSTEEAGQRQLMVGALRGSGYDFVTVVRSLFFAPPAVIRETYSLDKAARLFALFAKNQTWQVPTLTFWRNASFMADSRGRDDFRLRYVPEARKKTWNKSNYLLQPLRPEDYQQAQLNYSQYLKLTRTMQKAGVGLLAATGAYQPNVFPGFSLHEEMSLLVEAGLTPMEALQTATRNPAKYLGKLDTYGTIEAGKAADLVLLDADPVHDIQNTRKIRAVVVGGRLLDRKQLDQMLAAVEASARQAR